MTEYEKLRPTEETRGEGGFVREMKGTDGQVGFAKNQHVHKQWFQDCLSIDHVKEQAQIAADCREDLRVRAGNVHAEIYAGEFVLRANDRILNMSDWALSQFSVRVPLPGTKVLQNLRSMDGRDLGDVETMVTIANNGLRKVDRYKEFLLRVHDADSTCDAFLSDKYTSIDNRWYLDTLAEFLPDAVVSHWRGDRNTIYGNLLLPDSVIDYGQDDDTDYGAMLSISNCEIGKRKLDQLASLFRAICKNGTIWGQMRGISLSQVHRGNINHDRLKVEIGENIEHQLSLTTPAIREFLATQEETFDGHRAMPVFAAVAEVLKLTASEASATWEQWYAHEAQDRNLFGVINAVTRAGQTLSDRQWVKFDRHGGRLGQMVGPEWQSVLKRSRSLRDPELLKKTFGTAV